MTTSSVKFLQLESLREEIISTIPDPWFFPMRGKVKGFMGTAPIILIGERPSTGNFGGSSDRLLYSLMEKYNVADAHLTDVIKTRGKVRDPYPEDIEPHHRVFDREIEIISPRLIIAFGQKVYDLLQFSLAGSKIKIQRVYHYSYTRRGADKALTFEEQLRRSLDADSFLEHEVATNIARN